MKTFILLIISLSTILSSQALYSQDETEVPEEIIIALKTGNAKELSLFFGSTIELALLEKEEVYSKTQAEIILKDFFRLNPPDDFILVHQGKSDKSIYGIGSLVCGNKSFRVYFLLKTNVKKLQIHQLRIEKE